MTFLEAELGEVPELDLHGYRVGEIRWPVEDFVTESVQAKHHEVRIVHGRGSGALRQAVHEILKTIPSVKRFHDSFLPGTAGGVTLVILKEEF